ncbi:MAG: zinc ribbon domain-containing protein [Planctomycetota bacterium]|jgi:predicted  nucleic acid-binding Zn-ribbon protein
MTLTEDLMSLYRVDSQLRGLRTRVENAGDLLAARTRKLQKLTAEHAEKASQLRQLQAQVANLEGESSDYKDRIEKLRSELNASTNDKQYRAILAEMKSLETLRDEIETTQLAEMEKIEQAETEAQTMADAVSNQSRLCEAARTEHEECTAAVGERVGELESERTTAAARMPDAVLKIFEEVAETNEGETLAAVIELSKKDRDYTCGACHVTLPYHLVVNLHSNDTGVQQCPNCDRILHLETAEAEA